ILVYRLPDMVLHGRLCVVREPSKRGNLPGEQIGWVSLCDLLARPFLGSHDEVLRLENSRCCSADDLSVAHLKCGRILGLHFTPVVYASCRDTSSTSFGNMVKRQ